MASVKKSSKIDPYKLVSAEVGAKGRANPMVRTMVSNVAAVNNLGRTVNSIGAVVVDIKKINLNRLEQERKNRVKFKPEYTKPKKAGLFKWLGKLKQGKIPGFLESLLAFLGGLLKLFIILPIMKWLANPENREKVLKGVEILGKMLKIVASWAKFGTNMAFNGLYEMLADDSKWWERLLGFGKFIIGIGTLLLPLRWLTIGGAARLVADLKGSFTLIKTAVIGIKAWVATAAAGPLAFLFIAGGVAAMAVLLNKLWNQRDRQDAMLETDELKREALKEADSTKDLTDGEIEALVQGTRTQDAGGSGSTNNLRDNLNDPLGLRNDPLGGGFGSNRFSFAHGGKLAEFASGGWIHGPQSGYPVSTDGMGPSFIGHGTEYVAGGKSDGSSYIIPFDTKATRANPNLTKNRLAEASRMGYDLGGISRAVGGMVDKKIYLHWNGSSYDGLTQGRYHSIFGGSGKKQQNADYDTQASHTYMRNKNSIGLAIAAMGGKGWEEYPPTSPQLIGMMKEAARIGMSWGMKPSDVNRQRVMTQAEAASNKDGVRQHENYGPVDWGGTGERWGLYKLRKDDPDGSGGDRLRSMMKSFMQLPGKRKAEAKKIDKSEFNLLQRVILAEARGEGTTGMALVARAVLQRQALIKQSGKPGMFNSKGDTLTDVIMGKGQFASVTDGSVDGKFTEDEYKRAAIAISLAQNSRALRDKIMAEGFDKSVADNLVAATGFRTKTAHKDKSQNVNNVKYGNHIFNTAGNTSAKDLLAQKSNDRSAGDPPGVPYVQGGLRGKRGGQEEMINSGGGGGNTTSNVPQSGRRPTRATIGRPVNDQKIKKQTEDRNRARREMNARTMQMVQTALAAVEKKNNASRSYASQANAMAQQVLSSANTPTIVGGGGGGFGGGGSGGGGSRFGGIMGTAVNILNSFNNPLKGIFG